MAVCNGEMGIEALTGWYYQQYDDNCMGGPGLESGINIGT
jgi:hypothetical protein